MLERLLGAVFVIKEKIGNFSNLQFGEIQYSSPGLSLFLGLILLALVTAHILLRRFKRDKVHQKSSGYAIRGYYLRGFFAGFLGLLSVVLFAFAVSGMLLALAEPFLDQTQIREYKEDTESRVRVDFRDASDSMKQSFPGTSKSRAQVSVETHLEFLKMREGKNDRVSFWVFASYPHLIEDFIADDVLYYQQVEDAPWLVRGINMESSSDPQALPRERYGAIRGEGGGTDIVLAFQAAIKQFDEDEKILARIGTNIRKVKRSVLVLTDAEVYAVPDNELNELQKRNIKPYVIWIKGWTGASPSAFINRLRAYGGEYFDVTDVGSLKNAYESIDRLETAEIRMTKKLFSFRILFFQDFILAAIVIMLIAVLGSLFFQPFEIYP